MTTAPPVVRARWRRLLTPWNLVTLAVAVWAAPRLLPHLGAIAGVETGDRRSPRYDVTTLDGARLTTESLRGKVVLVNVWATWCGPCRAEMPLLEQMYERHRDAGLVILGLSVDRGPVEAVRRFVRARGVGYPIAVVGPDGDRPFGGVRGYPTSLLIDRGGVVRHEVLGPLARRRSSWRCDDSWPRRPAPSRRAGDPPHRDRSRDARPSGEHPGRLRGRVERA